MSINTNFNANPYYDDFDEDKKFLRMLFKPGFAVQARELTQLQTILQKQVERFGNHIFKNGSVVTGGTTYLQDATYLKLDSTYAGSAVTANNFIGNVVGGGAGTPTISSTTNLDLSAVSAVRVIGGGTFRLPSLTTAQIANTIAANGDMIYNSSVNKFQGYENGAWANII